MKYGNLIFEKKEFSMIKNYRADRYPLEDYAHKNLLELLDVNMSTALLFNADELPSDSVRMYSLVTVSITTKWSETFQLVAPFEANTKKNKVSVISSLGATVIGLSENDTVLYGLPGNRLSLNISEVKQMRKGQGSNTSEINKMMKLK
ncbi:MAG: GreA/GreB family elongation factor [Maribacter sp.]